MIEEVYGRGGYERQHSATAVLKSPSFSVVQNLTYFIPDKSIFYTIV